tara:strand:+ start:404 stop:592 length:189 start_codon:yes stop_codon:yes gene_type:complete
MKEEFEKWLESCPVDYDFLEHGQKLNNPRDLLSGFVEDKTVEIYKFYPIKKEDKNKNEGGVL